MALIIIFLLGIANFALHRAVLDSPHPRSAEIGRLAARFGRRVMLGAEFFVLLAALLMSARGWGFAVWAYSGYSLINGMAAWYILSRRF